MDIGLVSQNWILVFYPSHLFRSIRYHHNTIIRYQDNLTQLPRFFHGFAFKGASSNSSTRDSTIIASQSFPKQNLSFNYFCVKPRVCKILFLIVRPTMGPHFIKLIQSECVDTYNETTIFLLFSMGSIIPKLLHQFSYLDLM